MVHSEISAKYSRVRTMLQVKPYSLSYQETVRAHGHAVNGVDVGLGRIEHATVGCLR